jgi:F-type H+-transporting ATPase subunit delta
MFIPMHWAKVFFNSLEREGGDIEEGIEILKVLAAWTSSLPSVSYGNFTAVKMEKLAREGIAKAGPSSLELEIALRFLLLMVKKNTIRQISMIIDDLKLLLEKKRGVVTASVEYAILPGEDDSRAEESRIIEAIKERTGAVSVELSRRVNPDLIGGYRLRIGDEIIDASIRAQLKNLLTTLERGN